MQFAAEGQSSNLIKFVRIQSRSHVHESGHTRYATFVVREIVAQVRGQKR